MMQDEEFDLFRRILVALDASEPSLSALEIASAFAELSHGEIAGLFIAESDLLTLAGLRCSREVQLVGGALRQIDPQEIESELSRRAFAARRALERVASSRNLRWSFRSVQGHVRSEVAAAAAEVDLICVGRRRASRYGYAPLGSTLRTALASCAAVLIAGPENRSIGGAIGVLVDSAAFAPVGVQAGSRIAARTGQPLVAILAGLSEKDADSVRKAAADNLVANVPVRIVSSIHSDVEAIGRAVTKERVGLLVGSLPDESDMLERRQRLATVVECPVLLLSAPTPQRGRRRRKNVAAA